VPDPSLITDPAPSRPPGKLAARVRARWGSLPGNLRGGVWFLAGAAILTVMMALIKLAGQSLHVTEMLFFRQMTTLWEAGLLVLIGAFAAAGQYLNILALRAGEASALASLDFTRLVFAAALGLVMFGEWPANRVFLGAAVIVGAALYTLHRERRRGRGRV